MYLMTKIHVACSFLSQFVIISKRPILEMRFEKVDQNKGTSLKTRPRLGQFTVKIRPLLGHLALKNVNFAA